MRFRTELIISQLWVMGGLLAQDLKTVVIMFVFAVAWLGIMIMRDLLNMEEEKENE